MVNKKLKERKPMQVAPLFEERLKLLQMRIRKKRGENVSLRDLTENVATHFDDIEQTIINIDPPKIDFGIKLDRRKK